MQGTHREQASQMLGEEVTYVSRDYQGQTQAEGDKYAETETTVDARVQDITEISSDDTGLEQIGQIPDDGVVLHYSGVSADESDQFEVGGERHDILNLVTRRGDGGDVVGQKAYCKPAR